MATAKNDGNSLTQNNEDFYDYEVDNYDNSDMLGADEVVEFEGVDNGLIYEFSEVLRNGDDHEVREQAKHLLKTAREQQVHMTEMRIVLRKIAEITILLREEAEQAELEAEKIGNRIVGRKVELDTRATVNIQLADYLQEALRPIQDY